MTSPNIDQKSYTLMTPGPVPLPPEVLEVLAQPMEHHRTPEFVALFGRVLENLKKVFLTSEPVLIHTSTGSGGMESAVVNTLSPGDKVIAIVSGKFGERWAEMAETYGARVVRLNVPWGKAVSVAEVERALDEHPDAVALMTQACETSTAVLHPVRELARLTANRPTLFMVDAITALGALELPMDEWGIDVMVAGSQKAFMLPTGLSFISFSKKAWARVERAKCPRFYFDARKERAANAAGESGWSSAVTHIRALDLVLDIFLKQGLSRVHDRIQALSRATIEGARELGLACFAEAPSPSVTALKLPDGIDGQKVRGDMEKSSYIVVMGGQDQLKGKVIRIGHMGAIRDEDLVLTLEALAASLNRARPGFVSEAQIARAKARVLEILKPFPAVVLATGA
jgi:aspartate aminotransferase-like enzyme